MPISSSIPSKNLFPNKRLKSHPVFGPAVPYLNTVYRVWEETFARFVACQPPMLLMSPSRKVRTIRAVNLQAIACEIASNHPKLTRDFTVVHESNAGCFLLVHDEENFAFRFLTYRVRGNDVDRSRKPTRPERRRQSGKIATGEELIIVGGGINTAGLSAGVFAIQEVSYLIRHIEELKRPAVKKLAPAAASPSASPRRRIRPKKGKHNGA